MPSSMFRIWNIQVLLSRLIFWRLPGNSRQFPCGGGQTKAMKYSYTLGSRKVKDRSTTNSEGSCNYSFTRAVLIASPNHTWLVPSELIVWKPMFGDTQFVMFPAPEINKGCVAVATLLSQATGRISRPRVIVAGGFLWWLDGKKKDTGMISLVHLRANGCMWHQDASGICFKLRITSSISSNISMWNRIFLQRTALPESPMTHVAWSCKCSRPGGNSTMGRSCITATSFKTKCPGVKFLKQQPATGVHPSREHGKLMVHGNWGLMMENGCVRDAC